MHEHEHVGHAAGAVHERRFGPVELGEDGRRRYTGCFRDARGLTRSAGTFGTKREAVAAAAQAEVLLTQGRLGGADVGKLPFRRYVLWQRLQRALGRLATGASLTDVAHESGFADAAHLTRTFVRMIGAPPSRLARGVRWVDPSPSQRQPVRSSPAAAPARTLEA